MANPHRCIAALATTALLSAGALALTSAVVGAADKNTATQGGGCERDFANKGGGGGDLTAKGGCDDQMFNDGMRGISKRPPKPSQQPTDDATSSSAKPKTEQRK